VKLPLLFYLAAWVVLHTDIDLDTWSPGIPEWENSTWTGKSWIRTHQCLGQCV